MRPAAEPYVPEASRSPLSRLVAVPCAVALLAPLALSSIPLKDVTRAVAMTLAILSVNLMAGFVGRVALGHGAFVGAGAYTAVILSADHHWSLLATVPAAAGVGSSSGSSSGCPHSASGASTWPSSRSPSEHRSDPS